MSWSQTYNLPARVTLLRLIEYRSLRGDDCLTIVTRTPARILAEPANISRPFLNILDSHGRRARVLKHPSLQIVKIIIYITRPDFF